MRLAQLVKVMNGSKSVRVRVPAPLQERLGTKVKGRVLRVSHAKSNPNVAWATVAIDGRNYRFRLQDLRAA